MNKKIFASVLLSTVLAIGIFALAPNKTAAQSSLWEVAQAQVASGQQASVISAVKNLAKNYNISIPELGIVGSLDVRKLSSSFLKSILSVFSAPQKATAAVTPGEVGHWNFDDSTANDSSGVVPANNGAFVNGALVVDDATRGKVLSLDGMNDHLNMGNKFAFAKANAFSFSTWYKNNATTGNHTVISKEDASRIGYIWIIFPDVKRVDVYIENTTGSRILKRFNNVNVFDGGWHNLVLTYDGSGLAAGTKLYADNVGITDITVSADNLAGEIISSANFVVGSDQGNFSFLKGSLDDLRVYNKALTALEIADIFCPNGLCGKWNFDDSTANDSSGSANHGTLVGDASVVVDATRGKVLSLDGVNDFVGLGNPSSLQITGPMTVSAWVKTTDTGLNKMIVSKWNDLPANLAYILRIHYSGTAGRVSFGTSSNGSNFQGGEAVSTSSINNGQFHHIVGVFDGVNNKIYVDGGLQATTPALGPNIFNSSNHVGIGGLLSSSGGLFPISGLNFNGTIDDVRIYNKALTAEDIADIFNTPAAPTTQHKIDSIDGGTGIPTGVTIQGVKADGTLDTTSPIATTLPYTYASDGNPVTLEGIKVTNNSSTAIAVKACGNDTVTTTIAANGGSGTVRCASVDWSNNSSDKPLYVIDEMVGNMYSLKEAGDRLKIQGKGTTAEHREGEILSNGLNGIETNQYIMEANIRRLIGRLVLRVGEKVEAVNPALSADGLFRTFGEYNVYAKESKVWERWDKTTGEKLAEDVLVVSVPGTLEKHGFMNFKDGEEGGNRVAEAVEYQRAGTLKKLSRTMQIIEVVEGDTNGKIASDMEKRKRMFDGAWALDATTEFYEGSIIDINKLIGESKWTDSALKKAKSKGIKIFKLVEDDARSAVVTIVPSERRSHEYLIILDGSFSKNESRHFKDENNNNVIEDMYSAQIKDTAFVLMRLQEIGGLLSPKPSGSNIAVVRVDKPSNAELKFTAYEKNDMSDQYPIVTEIPDTVLVDPKAAEVVHALVENTRGARSPAESPTVHVRPIVKPDGSYEIVYKDSTNGERSYMIGANVTLLRDFMQINWESVLREIREMRALETGKDIARADFLYNAIDKKIKITGKTADGEIISDADVFAETDVDNFETLGEQLALSFEASRNLKEELSEENVVSRSGRGSLKLFADSAKTKEIFRAADSFVGPIYAPRPIGVSGLTDKAWKDALKSLANEFSVKVLREHARRSFDLGEYFKVEHRPADDSLVVLYVRPGFSDEGVWRMARVDFARAVASLGVKDKQALPKLLATGMNLSRARERGVEWVSEYEQIAKKIKIKEKERVTEIEQFNMDIPLSMLGIFGMKEVIESYFERVSDLISRSAKERVEQVSFVMDTNQYKGKPMVEARSGQEANARYSIVWDPKVDLVSIKAMMSTATSAPKTEERADRQTRFLSLEKSKVVNLDKIDLLSYQEKPLTAAAKLNYQKKLTVDLGVVKTMATRSQGDMARQLVEMQEFGMDGMVAEIAKEGEMKLKLVDGSTVSLMGLALLSPQERASFQRLASEIARSANRQASENSIAKSEGLQLSAGYWEYKVEDREGQRVLVAYRRNTINLLEEVGYMPLHISDAYERSVAAQAFAVGLQIVHKAKLLYSQVSILDRVIVKLNLTEIVAQFGKVVSGVFRARGETRMERQSELLKRVSDNETLISYTKTLEKNLLAREIKPLFDLYPEMSLMLRVNQEIGNGVFTGSRSDLSMKRTLLEPEQILQITMVGKAIMDDLIVGRETKLKTMEYAHDYDSEMLARQITYGYNLANTEKMEVGQEGYATILEDGKTYMAPIVARSIDGTQERGIVLLEKAMLENSMFRSKSGTVALAALNNAKNYRTREINSKYRAKVTANIESDTIAAQVKVLIGGQEKPKEFLLDSTAAKCFSTQDSCRTQKAAVQALARTILSIEGMTDSRYPLAGFRTKLSKATDGKVIVEVNRADNGMSLLKVSTAPALIIDAYYDAPKVATAAAVAAAKTALSTTGTKALDLMAGGKTLVVMLSSGSVDVTMMDGSETETTGHIKLEPDMFTQDQVNSFDIATMRGVIEASRDNAIAATIDPLKERVDVLAARNASNGLDLQVKKVGDVTVKVMTLDQSVLRGTEALETSIVREAVKAPALALVALDAEAQSFNLRKEGGAVVLGMNNDAAKVTVADTLMKSDVAFASAERQEMAEKLARQVASFAAPLAAGTLTKSLAFDEVLFVADTADQTKVAEASFKNNGSQLLALDYASAYEGEAAAALVEAVAENITEITLTGATEMTVTENTTNNTVTTTLSNSTDPSIFTVTQETTVAPTAEEEAAQVTVIASILPEADTFVTAGVETVTTETTTNADGTTTLNLTATNDAGATVFEGEATGENIAAAVDNVVANSDTDSVFDSADDCDTIDGRVEYHGCPSAINLSAQMNLVNQMTNRTSKIIPNGSVIKVYPRDLTVPTSSLYAGMVAQYDTQALSSCEITSGKCLAGVPASGNYFIIAKSPVSEVVPAQSVYYATPLDLSSFSGTGLASKNNVANLVIKKDGKLSSNSVNQRIVTGSLLNIYEPALIEIDEAEEVVPFFYETADDYWQVVTTFTPPEYCTSNVTRYDDIVNNEIKAAVFTLTCDTSAIARANLKKSSALARARAGLTAQVVDSEQGRRTPQALENRLEREAEALHEVTDETSGPNKGNKTRLANNIKALLGKKIGGQPKPEPKPASVPTPSPLQGEGGGEVQPLTLWQAAKLSLGANASNTQVTNLIKQVAQQNGISIPEWGIGGQIDSRTLKASVIESLFR